MGADVRGLGLRERKKIKTRQSIRRAAFGLFEDNGFTDTTIEDIAEAAEVSASTFFRYFPSKESVLLSDQLTVVMLDALAGQPAGLSAIAAFRAAIHGTYDQMTDAEWEIEATRQRLLYSLPELQTAQREEYASLVSGVSAAMARRLGRGDHELEVRVFAGAAVGAVMALGGRGPFSLTNVDAAMEFLESGMPLV